MKIIDIVYETLMEEVRNKRLFDALVLKWYGENANNQGKINTEDIYNGFNTIKEGLNVNNANIKTFLARFNGSNDTTREMFNPNDLKDIRKYSLKQIVFLLRQFNIKIGKQNTVESDLPPVLIGKNLPPSEERIEASKSLWFGKNRYLIVDEGDFRIYKIPDIPTSVAFGYYESYVTSNMEPYIDYHGSHMQWCTTRHMRSNNLWSTYRDRRTFYFIIDERYSPENEQSINKSQYYLCALQYATDAGSKYRLTSILNDGSDPIFTKEQIIAIYPKIAPHFDKLIKVEYDAKGEAGEDVDVVNLMNETEGNEYEFAIMGEDYKKSYIDRGKPITQVRSWLHMTDLLKKSYIDMTKRNNVFERFGPNLVDTILKKSNETKSLDRRLKNIGIEDGIGFFVRQFLTNEFELVRKSVSNPNIIVLQKKTNHKCGVYDTLKNKFVVLNGVVYGGLGDNDLFTKGKYTIHVDNEGSSYMVTTYLREATSDKFYTLYDTETASPSNSSAYILSNSAWEQLKQDLDGSKPEQHTDIKEVKHI